MSLDLIKQESLVFIIIFFLSRIHSVHTNENILNHIINQYGAFTDGDHFHFDQYYEKYPESVFILNTRPLRNWLISRYKHAKFHPFQPCCWCWPVSIQKTNQNTESCITLVFFSFLKTNFLND